MKALLAALVLMVPGVVMAQSNYCRLPAQLSLPDGRDSDAIASPNVPIRGYTLALSWSPEFCRSRGDPVQCNPDNGRFGFIIHGLWPEGAGRQAPLWCDAAPIPRQVVREQFCAMPSPRLIAHEWAKHGSCASRDPGQYFGASRKLFGALRFPDMNALSRRTIDVGAFKQIFAALNPAYPVSAIAVDASNGWLNGIRLCLNIRLRAETCPASRPRGAGDHAKS